MKYYSLFIWIIKPPENIGAFTLNINYSLTNITFMNIKIYRFNIGSDIRLKAGDGIQMAIIQLNVVYSAVQAVFLVIQQKGLQESD